MSEADIRTAAANMDGLAPHVAELLEHGLLLPLLRDFRRHFKDLAWLLALRRRWDEPSQGAASLASLRKALSAEPKPRAEG